MLVNDGNAGFTRILPTSLVVGTARSRADRANHNNIRVGGLDRVEDLLEAVPEHVIDEIFVADAQIFKVERFRMTHAARLAPHSVVAASPLQNSTKCSTSSMYAGMSFCAIGTGP